MHLCPEILLTSVPMAASLYPLVVKRRISFEKTDIFVSEDGIEHYPLFAAGFVKDMEKEWEGPEF